MWWEVRVELPQSPYVRSSVGRAVPPCMESSRQHGKTEENRRCMRTRYDRSCDTHGKAYEGAILGHP